MIEERKKITKKEAAARPRKQITANKKALFDFELVQKFEAGIALKGTEVKSLRSGKCNLQESYCAFISKDSDELVIRNMTITEYDHGNRQNHEPRRVRKLLLSARELKRMHAQANEKGYLIVPLSIYFSGHLVKLEIALAKPKKKFDKRESTKDREVKREINRKMKTH